METVLTLQLHGIELPTDDLALTANVVPSQGDVCKSRFGSKFQHQLKSIQYTLNEHTYALYTPILINTHSILLTLMTLQ